jgi:hypothetical protein
MSLITQAWNKIGLYVHKLTYDPEAEKFAKDKALKEQTEQQRANTERDTKKRLESESKTKTEADAKAAEARARLQKQQAEQAERDKFDLGRLIQRIFSTTFSIIGAFVLFAAAVWGSSLATNLNIYRDFPYRLLYTIYGFLFFIVVIPYAMLYRWFWLGKKPRYYALIPLLPYHLDHPFMAFLFGWLSFKPDDQMSALKEWEKEQKE